MTFYVYFSPYRNLVSIILSPVLLFCSSIVSFFSCSLKSQRRMPDRRLAPDPSRKRLIIWCPQISKGFFFPWLDGFLTLKQSFYLSIYLSTSKAVESRCCSRVERELSGNHLIYNQWQPYINQYPTWCIFQLNLRVLRRVFGTQTTDIEVCELPKLTYLNQL